MRPIDADLLIKHPFLAGRLDRNNGDPKYIYAWDTFREAVESMPTLTDISVSPRETHGKLRRSQWDILRESEYGVWVGCPHCGEEQHIYFGMAFRYCPDCGAKMMEDE